MVSHLVHFVKCSSVPVELSELQAYYTENKRKCFSSLCLSYSHATVPSFSLKTMFIYIIVSEEISISFLTSLYSLQ